MTKLVTLVATSWWLLAACGGGAATAPEVAHDVAGDAFTVEVEADGVENDGAAIDVASEVVDDVVEADQVEVDEVEVEVVDDVVEAELVDDVGVVEVEVVAEVVGDVDAMEVEGDVGEGEVDASPDDPDVADEELPTAPRCEAGLEGCVLTDGEACGACFARLAECCYRDADIQGMIVPLTAACEGRVECRRCCDECAAMTCTMLRAYTCPALR